MAKPRDPSEYMGLVNSIATKLANRYRLRRYFDELLAFGSQGLLEAHQRFDSSRGNAFSTYAYYRIKGAMIDGCRTMGWIRRRRRASALAEKVFVEEQEARLEDNPAPATGDLDAIARDLDAMVTSAAVTFVLGDSLLDKMPSQTESPEAVAQRRSCAEWIHAQVAKLPPQERELIQMSFFEEKTLEEIGEHLGCSKSWASRRRSVALDKLQRLLERSPDDLP